MKVAFREPEPKPEVATVQLNTRITAAASETLKAYSEYLRQPIGETASDVITNYVALCGGFQKWLASKNGNGSK